MCKIAYFVTIPMQSVSIFLKRAEEKNDGSLHMSFVTDLNSASPKKKHLFHPREEDFSSFPV